MFGTTIPKLIRNSRLLEQIRKYLPSSGVFLILFWEAQPKGGAMINPRNARRGYRERAMRRRTSPERQTTVFFPEEEKKMNTFWRSIVIVGIVCMTILCLAGCFLTGYGGYLFSRPVVAATPVPVSPTAVPEVAVTPPVPAPIVAACDTIEVSTDGGQTWQNTGENLETEAVYDIGNRVTWTARRTLVPGKAWNEKLSDAELKTVEQTWLDVRFNACETEAVVFAGGFQMGNVSFNNGVLFAFKGERQIRVRNGEIVLWYDQPHRDKDLGRIIDQIKNGNFDIHGPLALAVADGLKDVPVVADFLATRPEIKLVILP